MITDCIQSHVAGLMGCAAVMKRNNWNGVLDETEKLELSNHAITLTLDSIRMVLKRDIAYSHRDLQSRVAAAVKMFKMQHVAHGMDDQFDPAMAEFYEWKQRQEDDE